MQGYLVCLSRAGGQSFKPACAKALRPQGDGKLPQQRALWMDVRRNRHCERGAVAV